MYKVGSNGMAMIAVVCNRTKQEPVITRLIAMVWSMTKQVPFCTRLLWCAAAHICSRLIAVVWGLMKQVHVCTILKTILCSMTKQAPL